MQDFMDPKEIAGLKPIWVIDFRQRSETPVIQYYAPAKPKQIKPPPVLSKNTVEALDFLEKIKNICKKINEECKTEIGLDDLKKTKNISKELGDLDELIRRLNDLLKWFRHPDKKPESSEE